MSMLRFLVWLVGDCQFIDVPECLSSWKVQGIDLENSHFLYFAAFFTGIVVYAVQLKIRDRALCDAKEGGAHRNLASRSANIFHNFRCVHVM